MSTHIALVSVEVLIPGAQSLKAKRGVIKGLKDRIRVRHNVSVAEIGALDKWQRSVLGVCMIGTDRGYLDSALQTVLRLIEHTDGIELLSHQIDFL